MELSGALSNPRLALETQSNIERREKLLRRPAPNVSTLVKERAGKVSGEVYRVLERAGMPLRAKEIQRRCEESLGEPVSWSTVKQCLSDHAGRASSPIRRVAYGTYAHETTVAGRSLV